MDTPKRFINRNEAAKIFAQMVFDDDCIEVRSDTFQKCAALFLFLLFEGFAILLLLCLVLPEQFPAKDNFAAMGQIEKTPYYAGAVALSLTGLYVLLGTFRYRLRADQWGVTQCSGFAVNRAAWTAIESYRLEQTRGTKFIRLEPVLRNARGDVLLRPCAHPVVALNQTVEERAHFWQAVIEQIDAKRAA